MLYQIIDTGLALFTLALFAALLYYKNDQKTSDRIGYALIATLLYHVFGPHDGSPIVDSISAGKDPSLLTMFYAGVTTLAYIVTFVLLIKTSYRNSNQRKKQDGASDGLTQYDIRLPKFSFDDVEGMDALKSTLRGQLREIIGNGKNGILFHGGPGNGKTFIAEALAGELNKLSPKGRRVAFMPVSMATLASRWVNQTTEQLRDMFAQAVSAAETHGACVLFIDEIDSLLVNRANVSNADSEAVKNVTSMLTLVCDHHEFKNHRIIIVAATNYIDKLDSAAIREGRFDFKTEIMSPDTPARTALLINSAKKAGALLSTEIAKRAAVRWEGFSVSRMRHVGEFAAKIALKAGRKNVTFDDLASALREAQGCKGSNLPENTPKLDALNFADAFKGDLKALARRMTRVVEIEEMGGTVPKGVLFYGAPGTGKTAVAKALALESGWAFFSTTGQKIMNSATELDDLVQRASDLRPAIVFIDEADDILADRTGNPYGKSSTNHLLALMDGDKALKDVMFVAATNFEKALDAAAVRGGRFSEHFEFVIPDENALLKIIREFISSKSTAPWAEDFTPAAAAEILNGMSPADARDTLQKAINRVVARMEGGKITLEDLAAVA